MLAGAFVGFIRPWEPLFLPQLGLKISDSLFSALTTELLLLLLLREYLQCLMDLGHNITLQPQGLAAKTNEHFSVPGLS